jgi:hypothetical protein
MRRRLALLAVVLGGTALACQLVAGIERIEKVTPPAVEAGPDDAGAGDGDAAVVDPCSHVILPSPPLRDDAPAESLDPIYMVLRELTLSPSTPAGILGFDLDRSCTCDQRPGTAFDGGPSCVSSRAAVCDSDGGVDNQAGLALAAYAQFFDLDKAASLNTRVAEGKQATFLVLTRYNGRANDSEVGVGIFTSEGMRDGPSCPGSTTDADGFTSPGWCGEDEWTVSEETVTGIAGNFVPRSAGAGYVTNHQFVVELNGPVTVPFAGYQLTMGSPVASGRLVPLDANLMPVDVSSGAAIGLVKYWRAEQATLGGRVPSSELLAAAGTLYDPSGGGDAGGPKRAICQGALFATLKSQICDQVDISASKSFDFIPNARCDALSVALGVTGLSARAGRIVPSALAANDCSPTADGGGPIAGPIGVDYQCH